MTYISDPTSICFVPSPIAPSLPPVYLDDVGAFPFLPGGRCINQMNRNLMVAGDSLPI